MISQRYSPNRIGADETAAALMEAVLHSPHDGLVKGVLADRLDELGVAPYLAMAMRWCMARGKHPRISPRKQIAAWVRETNRNRHSKLHYALPKLIFDQIVGSEGGTNRSVNAYIAYVGLADAFMFIHETID
jgi:hypothetical protein